MIEIVDCKQEHLAFIYSSWLQSFKLYQKYVSSKDYYTGQHKVIDNILKRDNVSVLVTEDGIVGYICYNRDTVHWLYIKECFRGFKFGSVLLSQCCPDVKQYSHYSRAWNYIAPELTFNPYGVNI